MRYLKETIGVASSTNVQKSKTDSKDNVKIEELKGEEIKARLKAAILNRVTSLNQLVLQAGDPQHKQQFKDLIDEELQQYKTL